MDKGKKEDRRLYKCRAYTNGSKNVKSKRSKSVRGRSCS